MNDDFSNLVISRLDSIDDSIKGIYRHAASTDVTLAKQSVLLDEHIRRTHLLEMAMLQEAKNSSAAISPVKKHVEGMHFLLKAVGALAAIVGLVTGIYKLLGLN